MSLLQLIDGFWDLLCRVGFCHYEPMRTMKGKRIDVCVSCGTVKQRFRAGV